MSIQTAVKKVPSSDGVHTLWGKVYLPSGKIRGLFHVVHGMNEYTGRYDTFLEKMAETGYLSFCFDNLGHGRTAKNASELGFIARSDGWKYLIRDVRVFSDAVKEEYQIQKPYFLMGHSMGSFIVRCAALEEVQPDRLILMGSGGPNPLCPLGIRIAREIKKKKGERYVSDLLQSLVFGSYDRKFEGDYVGKWLCLDTENLKKYSQDPFCMFRFTVSAMEDLMILHDRANSPAFFRGISEDLPILFLSGREDPVGDYGHGVRRVHEKLLKEGKKSYARLYQGYRHEIFHDFCKEEVRKDILSFLKKKDL